MITLSDITKANLPKLELDFLIRSPNIAKDLPKDVCDAIGMAVVEGYDRDLSSRGEWEERNVLGMKLALQVVEQKSFPWEGCSNIKFPLITVAALQFLARISLMTKGKNLVKLDVVGADPLGHRAMQATRIANHIDMQLTEQDVNWLDDDEKCKLACAILGTAFKKTYNDSVEGIEISEYVPAQNFVVDYYCKNLDKATRATHLILMTNNDLQERMRRGVFLEQDQADITPAATTAEGRLEQAAKEAEGTSKPQDDPNTPYPMLEQYTWIDLDGDGYAEPYIVTVRRDTKQLWRIVARYFDEGDVIRRNDNTVRLLEQQLTRISDDIQKAEEDAKKPPEEGKPALDHSKILAALAKEQSETEKRIDGLERAADNHIIRITPQCYFTKYSFIPSPDGGFYDYGLGALLGPTNAAVNTTLNQLTDSGTMQNLGGGFLGRGVKMKGGTQAFAPGEWKTVDSTGADLKANIVPLPTSQPSNVLFELLGLLIGYAEKISGATDIMTGVSPGQNTPAETSRNTIEQGMMLFSGIYNRMYRSFRSEVRKIYADNRLYFKQSPHFLRLTQSEAAIVAPDDYDNPNFILNPAASPEATSTSQRRAKAQNTLQLAMTPNSGMDVYLAKRKFLEAWEEEDIDRLLPDPKGKNAIQAQPNPKMLELQQKQKEHEDSVQISIIELKQQAALNQARIAELQSKAAKEMAEAKGVTTGHAIAMLDAQIGAAKAQQDGVLKSLELLQKAHAHAGQMEVEHKKIGASHGDNAAGSGGMEPAPGND